VKHKVSMPKLPWPVSAAQLGDAEGLQDALSAGNDINDGNGSQEGTALIASAKRGHLACVRLLLERDADPDATDDEENTALHVAAEQGHLECVQVLLEKSDEDAENDSGNTPAWLALSNGHVEVAKALFDGGADLNIACEDGKSYLHQASEHNAVPAAKMLIERGAKVDALDGQRCTPLMAACMSGAWEVGRLLLEAKANVNAVGKDQWTPLHFCAQNKAAISGALDFAEKLVQAGADPKARTRDGLTASACVGLDSQAKRSKKVAQEDDEVRAMLEDLEYE